MGDLWTEDVRVQLIAHNGSVLNIDEIPSDMKELYKTVWEIKQRAVLDMAADRGAYIDQSQSLNIHMIDATTAKLSSMHFHGWQRGLKTGMYYLGPRQLLMPSNSPLMLPRLGSLLPKLAKKRQQRSKETTTLPQMTPKELLKL